MEIKSAEFVISNTDISKCPQTNLPEFAFIGRSNVGKSSLINMLANKQSLAKTSATPGKTQLINHFLINKNMYWVDLPGYGFAKVSQNKRNDWTKMIWNYIEKRKNLCNLFVLIDSRHSPQNNDIEFINKLGEKGIAFSILFTKADKENQKVVSENIKLFKKKLSETWEEIPNYFVSSSVKRNGRNDILNFISTVQNNYILFQKENNGVI
ncbi:MAG TPA: ribosome biogenesis GTP-binding protein YihA/YsxC [Chitinophagaceae bacterium]|nr:ribosome biogenesis GTP-binding protein YihA/YsxC [Chitinophagaceae bacterium]